MNYSIMYMRKLYPLMLTFFLCMHIPLMAQENFIGYFPRWHNMGSNEAYYDYLRELDFSPFTHVVYCFIVPAPDGTLHEPFDDTLMSILAEKGDEVGAKVLLGFAGGAGASYDPDKSMMEICENPTSLATFVDLLLEKVRYWNLDGLDNDWEPYWETRATRAEPYEMLMELLTDSLSTMDKMLMADIYLNKSGNSHLTQRSLDLMDLVNLMVYENNFGTGFKSNIKRGIESWSSSVPSEKINLVLPLFGRPQNNWGGVDIPYKKIVATNPSAFNDDSVTINNNTYWNYSPKSNCSLAKLVQDEKCGGIGFWAIDLDTIGEYSHISYVKKYVDSLNGSVALSENQFKKHITNSSPIRVVGNSVTLNTANAEPFSLDIYKLNGALVSTLQSTPEEPSIFLGNLNLANGMYLMRVVQGAEVFTRHFLLK